MPLGDGLLAYLYGSATGVWNVDWITFWGVILFNTLVTTGAFEKLRRWLIQQGTRDVRVQTILFAWAFGALLEGLVGFGYPWAFVAPILITLGIPALDAIRIAAIANNAPVSYGALGAPIIALAAVTGMPLLALAASVGKIVAILALLPPWILLYLVSGKEGVKGGWPLAIVGSLGYIAGQLPTSIYLGPYLPDVIGSIVCFACLLILLKVWRPAQHARLWRRAGGDGGAESGPAESPWAQRRVKSSRGGCRSSFSSRSSLPGRALVAAAGHQLAASCGLRRLLDHARRDDLCGASISSPSSAARRSSLPGSSWSFSCSVSIAQVGDIFAKTWSQMWGACLVGVFIFGLAYVFNYAGMAGSLASAFSKMGAGFHRRRAASRLHRRRLVRIEHLDQRHVRQVPGARRTIARLPFDAPADSQLGRAPKSANRSRRKPRASGCRPANSCATRAR